MKIKLDALIESIGVEAGLVFNTDGVLLEFQQLEYPGNIAAMSGVLLTMCKELLEDLKYGVTNELILQGEKGLFFVKKLKNDEYLGLFTKDPSKLGLIHLKMQNSL